MTLDAIEQDVYRRLGKNTTPDTATQTRVRAFVNQRIRDLLTEPDCSELRNLTTTFDSVASTAVTDLAVAIERVNHITDTANEIPLTEKSLAWYRQVAPDPSVQEGTPEVFVSHGLVETSADVWKFRISLWPTPSEALTYTVDYTAAFTDLASSGDVPPLPQDFHRLIVYGACMDECLKGDDGRYTVYRDEWKRGVDNLKYWLHARPSYRPGSDGRHRGSNLGSQFPSGRW
jgi:hypothetical protein